LPPDLAHSTPVLIDSLGNAVDRKELDGFLIVSDVAVDSGKVMYRASNVSSPVTIGSARHIISEMVNATRLERGRREPGARGQGPHPR